MEIRDEFIISFDVPVYVMNRRKTKKDLKVYLNLNTYRNTCYILLNKYKEQFSEEFKEQVDWFVKKNPDTVKYIKDNNKKIKIKYEISAKDKRAFDVSNLGSIIDKFACDVLVKSRFIEDDNFNFVESVEYIFVGVTGKRSCKMSIFIV